MSIFKIFELGKKATQEGRMQIDIMKMMAEQNDEKFLEYDRVTDTIMMSEIRDGKFCTLETVEGFTSKADFEMGRIYDADKKLYRTQLQTCLQAPTQSVFELRYIVPEYGPRWYRMFLLSMGDESGYVTKFAARMVNIQIEKETQDTMRTQAERDSLSGVYNHATYKHLCTDLAEKYSDGLMYVMIDIDAFKQINDTHGHHA